MIELKLPALKEVIAYNYNNFAAQTSLSCDQSQSDLNYDDPFKPNLKNHKAEKSSTHSLKKGKKRSDNISPKKIVNHES